VTRKFGYPATVYVVTDFCLGGKVYPATILEDEEPLCPEELRFLKSEGWSIGSHSRTHRRLARCPLDSAVEELLESRVRLSEALGAPTDHFSFPHGSWSWRLVDQLGKAGYRSGATSVEGINRVGDSPWLIKRIEVTPWDDLDTFRRKLLGWYDWLGWIRRVEAHDNA
jgi:peptidoglycan/xylan/chitin deacetylase (PgdA/CDA1 family)